MMTDTLTFDIKSISPRSQSPEDQLKVIVGEIELNVEKIRDDLNSIEQTAKKLKLGKNIYTSETKRITKTLGENIGSEVGKFIQTSYYLIKR